MMTRRMTTSKRDADRVPSCEPARARACTNTRQLFWRPWGRHGDHGEWVLRVRRGGRSRPDTSMSDWLAPVPSSPLGTAGPKLGLFI